MAWLPRARREDAIDDVGEEPPRRRSATAVTSLVSFAAAARGTYRIFGPAVYRFYRSTSAPPAPGDVPYATSASLPATPATTFADGTWYVSASYFDGVYDSGFLPMGPGGETYKTLVVSGGVAKSFPPAVPSDAKIRGRAGGVARVTAIYLPACDAVAIGGPGPADAWAITYTTDGSAPTPCSGTADVPTVAVAIPPRSNRPQLAVDLPAQVAGTNVKAIVQLRRALSPSRWAYSAPSAVLSVTLT